MKLLICLGTIAGLAASAHAEPAWCQDPNGAMEQGFVEDLKPEKGPEEEILAIAYLKCHSRDARDQAPADAAIKEMNKVLHLTDADWADVADFARSHGQKDVSVIDDKASWSARDPIEQYATFQHATLMVPGYGGEVQRYELADMMGPKLSQAGRMGYIRQCLRSTGSPAEWIACQGDIDALDFAKLDAEIRADKTHPGAARIAVRLAAYNLRPLLEQHAADVAKLKATDPTWGKLFDLGAQERKDWDARYRDQADLVALTAAMDDALVTGSRKASAGCKDKTWDALAKTIRALPAKSFVVHRQKDQDESTFGDEVVETTLTTLIGDPNAYLAADAYMLCGIVEKSDDILATNLQPRISRWYGFRGPRTGVLSRMILMDPQFDDRSAKVDFPQLQRFWIGDAREGGQTIAVVASVKQKGDKVTVSYAKNMVKVYYDVGCSNGRIAGVRGNGSIEYELNCKGTTSEMVDRRAAPEDIDARYAKELKPGMQSVIRKDALYVAWPKAGATIPVIVLGQPVK